MNMKSLYSLALKELLAQKMTALLIWIAIVLSTMMTTVIGQSAGVLTAMRKQQAIAVGGDRHASFVQLTEQQLRLLQNDPRISFAGPSVVLGSMEINSALSLGLTEYMGDSLSAYPSYSRLKKGCLPTKPMEIALPEDALQFLGFNGDLGDTLSLSFSKALRHGIETQQFDYTADFTLVGITESNYLGYTSGFILGIAGEGTAAEVLPATWLYYNVDVRAADNRTFQNTMNDLIRKLGIHELDTLYNIPYLNALGIYYDQEAADTDLSDSGFSWMLAAGIMTGALTLLAAGLVIFNILKISVSKRIRHFGILRAIGAEKTQLYSLVACELFLLCAAGIPVGMLSGLLSAKGILTAATGQLSPELFLVQDAGQLNALIAQNSSAKEVFLAMSAVITLLFAFAAAFPAAHLAAKVSPVAAMSGKNDADNYSSTYGVRAAAHRRRPIFSSTRRSRQTSLEVHPSKRTMKKIRCFEAYYARLNLKRSRGRTAVTILSLIMSITVFVALQSFVGLINASGSAQTSHMGDYSLVNEITGFSPVDFNELQTNEAVREIAALQFSLYLQNAQGKPDGILPGFDLQPGETFQVIGLNDTYWENNFSSLSKEQLAALKSGNGCVVRNPIPLVLEGEAIPYTSIEAGSTITVAGKGIPVLKTMDGYDGYLSVGNSGFTNGVQVIVNNSLYTELTGCKNYAEILPVLAEGADREAFDRTLDSFCRRIPGTTCISYEQTDLQLKESLAQINLLAWGLILFVGLIGLLNIINTVSTNIHTRVAEIGIQRAVGMSVTSLYQTFLWEGAYYGMIAAVIGCAAGYLCTVFVEAANTNALCLVKLPVLPMLEATVLAILSCLAATAVPLVKISKMSIVDSIETSE